MHPTISEFVKTKRKSLSLTQEQFAVRCGVGLRFLHELEQGKETLRMEKVNQVLGMLSAELVPVAMRPNPEPDETCE